MIKFNVASINQCTEVEGPYKRLTIWFQGCDILCEGCCNPRFQPLVPHNILTLDELVQIIRDAKSRFGIEGVTYSGGEPTMQSGLPALSCEIQKMGLGIISFTGHRYEDVRKELTGCDVVLDGPYDARRPEKSRRLLGSENQRIVVLTERYRDAVKWFYDSTLKAEEINITGDSMIINGDMI